MMTRDLEAAHVRQLQIFNECYTLLQDVECYRNLKSRSLFPDVGT